MPPLKALTANHVQPPRIAAVVPAAAANGRNADSKPTAIGDDQDRSRSATPATPGVMNRFARMLSAMLACSWMPGIVRSSPNGVLNTSSRPDAVKPTKTILSLKTAGSTSGFSPASSCCSDRKRWRNSYDG